MSVFDRFKRNGSTDTVEHHASEGVEKATLVALGTPAIVADAVNDTVDRFRNPTSREKDIKALRGQVEKSLKVAEKRGIEVRKQLPATVERSLKVAEKRGEEVRTRLVGQAKATRERVSA
jgi:hypothetical protein